VSQVTQVSKDFDARFAALARRYSYRIADRSVDPLTLSSVMIHDAPLDLDAMNAASKLLQGLNDFTAYCKANTVGTRIRELQEFSWHRHDDLVIATVKADAFCYSMVRTLVGALIPVGDGRKDIEWPYRILKAAQKIFEINVAPGHALVLEEIYYPAEKEFADRVSSTKAMRSPEEVE
jgi:tRNA pseudouridine38-40 synthase